MLHRLILAARLVSGALLLICAGFAELALTPVANGPYHISGNRILDSQGRPYLIRGTQLAPLSPNEKNEQSVGMAFGPLSATTIVTVRQRFNMDAVRLPISAVAYQESAEYRARVDRLVRTANQFELLAILETQELGSPDLDPFWTAIAARFKDNPNVFFAPLLAPLAAAVRRSGARQPLILALTEKAQFNDRDIIYEITPHYAAITTDHDRWQQFGLAAETVPVIVNGLDPQLDRASEDCAQFPADPADATALIAANLAYFDAHAISWTLSSFTAGKLVTSYRGLDGTKLQSGWTCGKPDPLPAGIGILLLAHFWQTTPLGLFTVSESRGSLVVARGGVSTAYGPTLAEKELVGHPPSLPTHLGNITIRVTDSRGVARLAPLLHTSAGWSFISFLIPEESATGPAAVDIVRTDGSISKSKVLIADTAPGLFTFPPDGRSVVAGYVTQSAAGKPNRTFQTWKCGETDCDGVPISLAPGVATMVRLLGTGIRHAGPHPDVRVTVGGMQVPVLSVGPGTARGSDQITIRLPNELRGLGDTDLYFTLNGEISNVVRINCGS